ncbi:Panacea domain-containing protein [Roseateles sp.]|uniref:Panacea domain-containing protein n=1 Tax=Roseateles sp. TaxID=1971397 RepID=UPI0031CF222A
MFSAYSVANAFIQRAIDGQLHGLNSMKLQKLMYFAQAWHLKGLGRPLFQDTFIREKHGPVLPSIEYQLNAYGSQRVGQLIRTLTQHDDPLVWNEPYLPETAVKARELVDAIVSAYGDKSGLALSDLTHLPNSAWSQGPADGGPMLNEDIRNDPTL